MKFISIIEQRGGGGRPMLAIGIFVSSVKNLGRNNFLDSVTSTSAGVFERIECEVPENIFGMENFISFISKHGPSSAYWFKSFSCFGKEKHEWIQAEKIIKNRYYFFISGPDCFFQLSLQFFLGPSMSVSVPLTNLKDSMSFIKKRFLIKKTIMNDIKIKIDVEEDESLWSFGMNAGSPFHKNEVLYSYVIKKDTAPPWGDNGINLFQDNFLLSRFIITSWKKGRLSNLIKRLAEEKKLICEKFPELEKYKTYDLVIKVLSLWKKFPNNESMFINRLGLIKIEKSSVTIRPFYRSTEFDKFLIKKFGQSIVAGDIN